MSLAFPLAIASEALAILLDSAVYILFGIVIAGLLKTVLNPETIYTHLGRGRYSSVLKAAIFGVPLPLCSCGVLPAATALQKQGANKGATTAFLISTPESGVDSIAITYALLDPIMTVVRPIAALVTALCAGLLENFLNWPGTATRSPLRMTSSTADCCGGEHAHGPPSRDSVGISLWNGLRYGVRDVWADIALWFYVGLIIAACITVLVPDEFIAAALGGGIGSMFIMLLVGVPLYICATASTPIAAALILKGVSPGAALVFLLVGPATNITSLSVLFGVLGKMSTLRYLLVLSLCAVLFGLGVDWLYGALSLSPRAVIGEAAEIIPQSVKILSAGILVLISIKPLAQSIGNRWRKKRKDATYFSPFPPVPRHGGHRRNGSL